MLKEKEKLFKFFICVNIILATIIGLFAQDITSYIVSNYLLNTSSLYYLYILTILTILSIMLFLSTPISMYIFSKKYLARKQAFILYFFANTLMGILVSMFSIFVLVMSWG